MKVMIGSEFGNRFGRTHDHMNEHRDPPSGGSRCFSKTAGRPKEVRAEFYWYEITPDTPTNKMPHRDDDWGPYCGAQFGHFEST